MPRCYAAELGRQMTDVRPEAVGPEPAVRGRSKPVALGAVAEPGLTAAPDLKTANQRRLMLPAVDRVRTTRIRQFSCSAVGFPLST